jgi:hypothetical protein
MADLRSAAWMAARAISYRTVVAVLTLLEFPARSLAPRVIV